MKSRAQSEAAPTDLTKRGYLASLVGWMVTFWLVMGASSLIVFMLSRGLSGSADPGAGAGILLGLAAMGMTFVGAPLGLRWVLTRRAYPYAAATAVASGLAPIPFVFVVGAFAGNGQHVPAVVATGIGTLGAIPLMARWIVLCVTLGRRSNR
jgi:hypothetical protein